MNSSDVKLLVRNQVLESRNALCQPQSQEKMVAALQRVEELLPYHNSTAEGRQKCEEFLQSHYARWLSFLLEQYTVEWVEVLGMSHVADLYDVFFFQGSHHQAFSVLVHAASSSSGFKMNKCISLLETFLVENHMEELIWEQCEQVVRMRERHGNQPSRIDPDTQRVWHELVTLMATLPERMTSKLQSQCSDTFYPEAYLDILCQAMVAVMWKLHAKLESSQSCSVEFLSQLLGRLCLTGHSDRVWQSLMPQMVQLVAKDYIWCRLFEKVITMVPDRCLESTILPLVKHCPWFGLMPKFLGHAVLSSHKLQFLLTNKMLLVKHFTQDVVLQNIIGYLSHSGSTRHLHTKVLKTLLDVWGDSSALRHTSYEQHLYISKAIIISLTFLQDTEKQQLKSELIRLLMPGVQVHLDSSDVRVRRLGMIVAETLTKCVDPAGHKLTFEYEKDEEVNRILSLLVIPEDPGIEMLTSKLESASVKDKTKHVSSASSMVKPTKQAQSKASSVKNLPVKLIETNSDSELDSDDDFVPYDMSHDVKLAKVREPVYLRDCMEGLMCSDNPDRVEICARVAEKLIRAHPSSVLEIAVEFSKILLHLQDSHSLPGMLVYRHRAMVALAVTAPQQVAGYLTHEFYERNYNISQRLDILQTLAAAAQELSNPASGSSSTSAKSAPKITVLEEHTLTEGEGQNWRDIVQQRIESKTRRFAKGRQQPEPTAVANKFAPVAGSFFFPLMVNFDKQDAHCNLLGDDHLVLSRLIYTLGSFMYSALHAPIASQMGSALLEFIWVFRYHPQAPVREALLYAVSMVMLAVPGHILLNDLQTEVMEAKNWLEDVAADDASQECQKRAIQALMVMQNCVKKEFGSS